MSEENKKIGLAFYQKLLDELDVETAIKLYGGKDYKQHNPLVEDGWDGLRKFIGWIRSNYPKSRMYLKHAFAHGDCVITHSNWVRVPGERGDAVVDIFRVSDGKVVEHWDVIQPIPETAANKNTMF